MAATLSLEQLHWTTPRDTTRAALQLANIALDVRPGEFVGLIGPNGSGKTSLLRCAFRLEAPHSGHVRFNEEDLWQQTPRWVAQRIAVLLQEFPEAFDLSVIEVVALGRLPHQGRFSATTQDDLHQIERALADVGLTERQEVCFGSLSGGEKQRVLLARALAQEPQLLILDEPTNHLDPRYQIELLRQVKRLGISVLASLHDLNLAAAFCDRLYVLDHGRLIASGTPEEVITPDRLRAVFGIDALVDRHPIQGHPRITWISET